MSSVNADSTEPTGGDHLLTLIDRALRSLRPALRDLSAPEDVRRDAATLRSSQIRLLSLTPVDGMRLTDLAHHVGMSKQALGEFATALETRGLMESVRDPHDQRVRIIRPTARGLALGEATERAIVDLEARLREIVGADDWDTMRRVLDLVADKAPELRNDQATTH